MKPIMCVRLFPALFALVTSAFCVPAFAVTAGQIDDFEDGSTQGWGEGAGVVITNPNPPTNEPTGGPAGAGDNFLQNISTGTGTAGSRQVIINSTQWAGDYAAAEIAEVRFKAKIIAGSQAHFRVAFQSVGGTRVSSTNAVIIANDGAWHDVTLPVSPSDLSVVSGLETVQQVLSTVTTTRIVSAALAPAWIGDSVALTVGYDDITAITAPATFQGWLWGNSLFNSLQPELDEEVCFGRLTLDIAGDDTWVAGRPDEICWGRVLENLAQPRSYLNFDGSGFPIVGGFDAQSTRPLVSAGGNLVELYGEDVIGGFGQGETRLATILAEPSGSDVLIAGGYSAFVDASFQETFSFVHLLAKRSSDVATARSASDLQGLWRISFFERVFNRTTPAIESTRAMVYTVDLQANGVCNFIESGVFQEADVNSNGDYFNIVLSDLDATNLANQRVNAQVFDRTVLSNCTYSVDAQGQLNLSYTQSDVGGVVGRIDEYVVSDDNNFLVAAADPVDAADATNALVVGYRAANGMSVSALDGNYLFYLNFTEYEATGTGSSTGNIGPQQFDGFGRGVITFDSTMPGVVPAGQTGDWRKCVSEITIDDVSYEVGGDPGQFTVSTAMSPSSEKTRFSSCDYRLNPDGALLVSLGLGAEGSILFAGYVNGSGELVSLVNFFSEPEPSELAGEDFAVVRHGLGLRYVGDLSADEDSDGLSNLQEFMFPLAPIPPASCSLRPLPAICALPDINGNGSPDIAVAEVAETTRVLIRDGSTDELISDIDFGADTPHAIDALPDLNANGHREIALLNTQASGHVRVQVRDSLVGDVVRNWFYGSAYGATAMRILDDYNGNGAPEIAVMGSDATDAIRVQVKDADSGATLDNVFLGNQGIGDDFVAVTDFSGNSRPELAILSVLKGNDQVRTQVWDSVAATFEGNIWFGKVYQPFKLLTIPDVNGNGSDEIVAVGVDPATQNIRVQARDSQSAATVYNIWLGNKNAAVDIALINDINGNGYPDLAVLLRTPAGTGRVRVQDGQNGAFIRNLFYTVVEAPAGLAVMPDYNGSGFEELAVVGENAGVRHVQVLDTSSGSQVNRIDYP